MPTYKDLFAGDDNRWHDGSGSVSFSFPIFIPDYYDLEFIDKAGNKYHRIDGGGGFGSIYKDDNIEISALDRVGVDAKATARLYIESYKEVANINAYEIPSESKGSIGDITVAITPAGANSAYGKGFRPDQGPPYEVVDEGRGEVYNPKKAGDVWIVNYNDPDLILWVMYHEIGHALGLSHPEDDGVHPDYDHRTTIMSYNPYEDPALDDGEALYPGTPMLYDIQALQFLYGANYETRSGNTAYFADYSSATYRWDSSAEHRLMTIWDGGGIDTIDVSHFSENSIINLAPGSFSSIGGLSSNIALASAPPRADGTIPSPNDVSDTRHFIENALTGSGDDLVIGNAVANRIITGSGRDTAWGGSGDDQLYGAAGNDTLSGESGNDFLFGGNDHDTLVGGSGADYIDGGAGIDVVSYGASTAGVTVNLASGEASGGHAEGDRLFNIETLSGSSYADSLTGDRNSNILSGSYGTDTLKGLEGSDYISGEYGVDYIEGGADADYLYGGEGYDYLVYENSPQKVTVNLLTGYSSGGHATGDLFLGFEGINGSAYSDTLSYINSSEGVYINLERNIASRGEAEGDKISGFENILGSLSGSDMLIGSAAANNLQGFGGNDYIYGLTGDDTIEGSLGADFLDGGGGFDFVSYENSNAGVFVDLNNTRPSGGHADGDFIRNFEGILGSSYADGLTGTNARNIIEAGNGNDLLSGLAGDDTLYGEEGNDIIIGGLGSDGMIGGAGSDTFITYASDVSSSQTDYIMDYDPEDSYSFERSLSFAIDIEDTAFGAAFDIFGWQMVVMGSTVEQLEDQMDFFG